MKFDEFKKLVKSMKAVFATPNFLPDGDSIKTWYMLLQDIPFEKLSVAVQKHIMTSKYPPTIAELRAAAISTERSVGNWSSGWEQFQTAIRKFGYYRQEEAFDVMDELTRTVVKRLGWKNLCMSENPIQDRANFRMIYEQEEKRVSESAALPKNLQNEIERLRENAKIASQSNEKMLIEQFIDDDTKNVLSETESLRKACATVRGER